MNALLIAEKPSLMRAVQDVYRKHRQEIGMNISFVAQVGHILGLKMPDEVNPVYKKWDLENLPLSVPFRYKVLNGKYNMAKQIKDEIKSGKYDVIIHAGDAEQEGELLIRETLDYAHNELPVLRFWNNDLTEEGILASLRDLQNDNLKDALAAAGYIRQHEDYNYGINLTEAMTLKSGTLVRMGRVKAAIVSSIVEREREIEEFVPSSTYQRAFVYEDANGQYQFVDESETFETEELLAKSMTAIPTKAEVLTIKQEEKLSKAPKLYKLSSLQTDAFNKLHFSANKTLATLQSLYEKKVTTYPRSSCEYLTTNTDIADIYHQVKDLVPELDSHNLTNRSFSSITSDKAVCNNAATSKEGHTAIIPTGKRASLTEDERKLYNLIVRRFVAVCLPPKKTLVTTITAKDENDYRYVCKGVQDIAPSYEYVLNPNYQPKQFVFVPTAHSMLDPVTFEPKEIAKKCPSRYNEGSLIKFLAAAKTYEDAEGNKLSYSIGTEATRANIIKECMENNYFTSEGGTFVPTDFAKTVIRDYGDLAVFDIETSAQWEAEMEAVRHGEAQASQVEASLNAAMIEMVNDIKERTVTRLAYHANKANSKSSLMAKEDLCKCPCCETGMIRENTKAFGCTNWNADPKCDFTLWKSCFGANLTRTDAKKLIEGKTIIKTLTSKAGSKYKKELAYDFDNRKVVWASELNRSKDNEVER